MLEENVKNAEKLVDKVKIIAESSKMVASNAIAQPLSTGLPFGSQPDRASAEIGGASSVSVAVPLHTIETGLKEPVLASSQTEHSKTGLVSQVVKIGESVVSGLENAVQNTETVVAKLFHQGQVKSAQKNGTNLKPSELRKTQKGVGSFKSSLVAVKHDDEEKSTAKAKVQELITSNNVDLIKAFTDLRNARSKQPKNVGALKAEIMRLLEEKGVVSRSDQSSSPLGVQDFNTLFSFAFDPLPQGNKSVEINPASQLVSKKVSAPGKEKSVDAAGEIAASRAQDQKLEELKQQQAVAAKASGSEGKQAVPLVQAEGGSQAPEEDLFAALTPENIQAMKTNVEQIISKLNPTNLLESLKLRSLNLFLKVCESRDLRSIEGAWSALPADQKEIINKDLLQAQNKQVAAKNRALDAQQAALAKADQDAKNAAYNAATPSQKLANRDWGPKYRAEILEAQKQVVAQALFGGNKNADLVALVDQVDQAKTAYNQVYVFKEQPSDDAPVGTAPRVLKPGEVPSVKKAGRLIEPNPDALKSAQNELLKAEIAVFAKFHDLIKSSLGEKYGAYATLGINETGLDGVKTPVDYTNAASIKDSIALNSKYQVLFGQKPPTKPASKAQAETPAQEQDSVEIVKLIDGVDVTTYAKMKKIGVVDQLISQKMKDDGIAQNVIDRLLLQQFDQPARVAQIATVQGAVIDGITNLALLPYLKKLKMGTLNQAVVVQMTQDGMSQADIETIQSLALQPIENIQATYDALEKSSAQPKSDIAQTDVALSPDDQKTVQTFLDADYAGVVKNSTSIMKKRMAVVAYKKLNEAQKNWLNANDAFDPAVLDLPAKVVEPQSDQVENNAEVGADSSIATKASGVAALANQDSLSVLPLQNAVASQSSSLVGSVSSLPVAPADVSGVDKFKELIRKEGLIGAAGKTSLALPSLFDAVKPSTQSKPRSALQTPGILQGDLGSDFNGAVFNDLISGRSRGLQPQQPQPPVQVGVQLQ